MPLREEASLVLYLVSPDYALRAGAAPTSSRSTRGRSKRRDVNVFFASAVQIGEDRYSHGRNLARRGARDDGTDTLGAARSEWCECAASVGVLEWRREVGE